MNTTLLITGAIVFAGALLLAWPGVSAIATQSVPLLHRSDGDSSPLDYLTTRQ